MAAKPIFTKAQYEVLFEAARKARTKFKNQEDMALALGITQQSLSALLKRKYNPGLSTAKLIAHTQGITLHDLIGDYAEEPSSLRERQGAYGVREYPNLDTCLSFYATSKSWAPWTIAAARAGFFGGDDYAPPAWHDKLDALDDVLSKARADLGPIATAKAEPVARAGKAARSG